MLIRSSRTNPGFDKTDLGPVSVDGRHCVTGRLGYHSRALLIDVALQIVSDRLIVCSLTCKRSNGSFDSEQVGGESVATHVINPIHANAFLFDIRAECEREFCKR